MATDPPEMNHATALPLKWPLWTSAIAVFLPNGLAGLFNFLYNLAWLMKKSEESYSDFLMISGAINLVSFSLGWFIFLKIVGPFIAEVRARQEKRMEKNSSVLGGVFTLGHKTAFFGMVLWLSAGVIFPIALATRVPAFDYQSAIHFFLSLAVCGTIAAAYPFLGMSLIAVECWYGILLGKQLRDPSFTERAEGWCDGAIAICWQQPASRLQACFSCSAKARQRNSLFSASYWPAGSAYSLPFACINASEIDWRPFANWWSLTRDGL